MATFTDMTAEQTASIQEWTMTQINQRMELAGRAVDFISSLDQKQKEVQDLVMEGSTRVSTIVSDFNVARAKLDEKFAEVNAKMEAIPAVNAKVEALFTATNQARRQAPSTIIDVERSERGVGFIDVERRQDPQHDYRYIHRRRARDVRPPARFMTPRRDL